MLRTLVRWAIPLLALFVVGPLAGWLTYSLKAPDGGPETTLLLSAPAMSGLLAGAGVMAMAALVGALGAWINDARNGLTAGGFVLAWGAWGLSRIDLVLSRIYADGTVNTNALYTVALEAVLVGVLGVASAWLIFKIKPIAWSVAHHAGHHHEPEPSGVLEPSLPVALAAATAVGALVAWIMAADTLKGQTFAAATLGGLCAAAVGRVMSQRVSGAVFVAAIALLAVAGPAIASQMHATGSAAASAARAGRLIALARPLPLDWMAGAFVGVPIGLAWAGSMVEKKHHHRG